MINTCIHKAVLVLFIAIRINSSHLTISNFKRLFNRLRQTTTAILVIYQPINNYINGMFVVFIEFWEFIKRIDNAVYTYTSKSGTHVLFWNMLKSTFFINNYWRQNHEFGGFWQRSYFINDRLRCLTSNRFTTNWAVRYTNASE